MLAQTLTFDRVSTLNKAAGDPLRLEVLRVLARDSYGVLELCEIFEHKQSGMSHHLKVLSEAGLVAKRREGNSIFYSRALPNSNDELGRLHQQLCATVDAITVSVETEQRAYQVQQARAEQSQQFFAQQAHKFKAQQDLIAEYPSYGETVTELLRKTSVPNHMLALEVGPGAGEFLPVLAGQFEQVIALDNAPTMLAAAEQFCAQQSFRNIDFVCGDTQSLLSAQHKEASAVHGRINGAVDCVVMNMVLHHISSPADMLNDIAQCLKVGGILLMTDLCRHDQDWAKSACGDMWLGFDADELQHWADLAGLEKNQSHYLALRNGFQIQLQQFRKRY